MFYLTIDDDCLYCMECTPIFYSFLKNKLIKVSLQAACWKTLPWTTLSCHSPIHHSGYSLPFLLSCLIIPLNVHRGSGLLLHRESHWVVTSSACRHPASICTGTVHSSVLFPSLKGEVSFLHKCSRYHPLNSGPTHCAGSGWLQVVLKYVPKAHEP